jgi:hypothetical protein
VGAATVGVGGSVAIGASVARSPWAAAGAVAGCSVVVLGIFFARRLPRLFLGALGVLLIGYAFFGRSFAYLGVPPIFVGEMVLALGLLAALVSGGLLAVFRQPLAWVLVAFAGWCATRTVPYVRTYHLDALRDAVLWGYGVYALLVPAFLPRSGWIRKVPRWYARVLPWFVLWVPIGFLLFYFVGRSLPTVPGSDDVPLIDFKTGDASVHLAGVAAFLLLGLYQIGGGTRRGGGIRPLEWFIWAVWLVGFMFVAATNRGGALASFAAIFTVVLLRPAAARWKIPAIVALATVLTLGVQVVNTSAPSLVDRDREMSPEQIVTNLKSIVEGGGGEALEGSRRWRLAWWDRIMEYTIHGDLFWTGKGFGINLADDDGFQVASDHSLRSPHNAHLTVLARGGVPALFLWVLLQGAFALSMVSAYLRAQRMRYDWWARLDLWVLAYWVASLVNASFDVYIEGPQGGIWFWSLIGFGMALLQLQQSQMGGVLSYTTVQARP